MTKDEQIRANRAARDLVQWSKTLRKVAAFITVNGRRPSTHSDDWDEPRHANWLTAQRGHLRDGTLSAERRAALDAAIPRWNIVQSGDAKWWPRAAEAHTFTVVHDRAPNEDSADAAERSIGRWLTKQRKRLADSAIPAEQAAHLDEHVIGWRDRPAPLPKSERHQPKPADGPKQGFRYASDMNGDSRFDDYPRGMGGMLATLTRSPRRPAGIPEHLIDRDSADEWLSENALGEAAPLFIESMVSTHLEPVRPGLEGADALYTWVEWAEFRAWLGDDMRAFLQGLYSGAVLLMATALKLPAAEARAYADGSATPSRELYELANDYAITHGTRRADLDLWLRAVAERSDDRMWRGQAVAAAALGRVDGWWAFRDMSRTTADV